MDQYIFLLTVCAKSKNQQHGAKEHKQQRHVDTVLFFFVCFVLGHTTLLDSETYLISNIFNYDGLKLSSSDKNT